MMVNYKYSDDDELIFMAVLHGSKQYNQIA